MAARVRVLSVLNPAGPKNLDDRVLMLGDANLDYEEPWPEYGCWEELEQAQQEAERINGLSEAEFDAIATEIANR